MKLRNLSHSGAGQMYKPLSALLIQTLTSVKILEESESKPSPGVCQRNGESLITFCRQSSTSNHVTARKHETF